MVPNEAFGIHVPAGKVWPEIEATVNGTADGVQEPPGWPKFGWLKMLKNSVRNSRLKRSASRVLFRIEKSKLLNPGPVTALRPRLPNWFVGAPAKASGLKKLAGSGFNTLAFPMMLGRTVPATFVSEDTPLRVMVTGLPLCRLVLPENAQPSTSRLPRKGSSY